MTENPAEYAALDQQIDAIFASQDALEQALDSDNPLLRAAARLASKAHPTLRPTARDAIKQHVLSQQVPASGGGNIIQPQFMQWFSRIAAGLIAVIMIGFASQPASASSLPGDPLYPVKRGWEQVELIFASSSSAEIATRLEHTSERLSELDQLPATSPRQNALWENIAANLDTIASLSGDSGVLETDVVLAEQAQSVLLIVTEKRATIMFPPAIDEQLDTFEAELAVRLAPPAAQELALPEATTDAEETQAVPEASTEPEETQAIGDIVPEASETQEVAPSAPETDAFIPFTLYVAPAGAVNVRTQPGLNATIAGTAQQNTPVTVTGQSGDWYEVELPNGLTGWIFADVLDNTPGRSGNDGAGSGNRNGNGNGNDSNRNGNANGNRNG